MGDDSGKFLYPALWRAGFANQPNGEIVGDGLALHNLWITAVCRCVPPDNKPTHNEIVNCRPYLEQEQRFLTSLQGIVALGKIAWEEITREYAKVPAFSHGAILAGDGKRPWVLASYHPSRQNTQTGRLTAPMFDEIWNKTNQLLMN